MRIWRLEDGAPLGSPLTGHTGPVTAVAIGILPDATPIVVSGSEDGTVRVWRLEADYNLSRLTAETKRRHDLAIGGAHEERARMWESLHDNHGAPLTGHSLKVEAVAVAVLPDGTRPSFPAAVIRQCGHGDSTTVPPSAPPSPAMAPL